MGVCVLGGINLDHVAIVDRLPAPGETVTSQGLARYPGGKGANQAIASSRAGALTRMLGTVGDDEPGAFMLDFLAGAGVDLVGVVVEPGSATGQAFITVDALGRNCIVVAAGANALFGAEQVARADLSGAGVFLTQFEAPLPAIEALFQTPAARAGVKILNAAPALTEGAPLLALADIVVLNEIELARFAGLSEPPQDPDSAGAAALALARPGQAVIATLGGDGVVIGRDGRISRISGRTVRAVDTTGAGDCFCGALAARLDLGSTLEDAVAWANAAAAISVTRAGAATSSPSHAEVEAFLGA